MKSGPDTPPPPDAPLEELHAWAARTGAPRPSDPAAGSRATVPGPRRETTDLASASYRQDTEQRTRSHGPNKRAVRAVLVLAAAIGAYALFSVLVGLLVIVGTVAAVGVLLFVAFKAGRLSGRRSK